jgi:hypothetical protein
MQKELRRIESRKGETDYVQVNQIFSKVFINGKFRQIINKK